MVILGIFYDGQKQMRLNLTEQEYLESRVDLMIDNEIKEVKLAKYFAKKNLIDSITNVEAPKLKTMEPKEQVYLLGDGRNSDISKVGT